MLHAQRSFDWSDSSQTSRCATAIDDRTTSRLSRALEQTSLSSAMPICIECRYPVSSLYTTYSKADDKALGKGVRLTQCPACKIPFADKYVEHDFVVLFIDLVLIKPQVGFYVPLSMMYRRPRLWHRVTSLAFDEWRG